MINPNDHVVPGLYAYDAYDHTIDAEQEIVLLDHEERPILNLDKDEAIAFAARLLELAMQMDGSYGWELDHGNGWKRRGAEATA